MAFLWADSDFATAPSAPQFEIVRPIPSLSWIPIVFLFLGIGVQVRAVIILTGCCVATVLNTYTGIRSTNQTLINVAKTCGASAEMLASSNGLGYMIQMGRYFGVVSLIMAGVLRAWHKDRS